MYEAGAWWQTHEQWVGLRLLRTSASGKLVKVHLTPHVAAFCVNSRVKVTGFQRLVGFFLLRSCTAAGVSRLVWERLATSQWVRPLRSARDLATGDSTLTPQRKKERARENKRKRGRKSKRKRDREKEREQEKERERELARAREQESKEQGARRKEKGEMRRRRRERRKREREREKE